MYVVKFQAIKIFGIIFQIFNQLKNLNINIDQTLKLKDGITSILF